MNGIHHVTAIAGPPRRNLEFYTRTLGLRLVKRTVNFDDPGTWHLYYGDAAGQPGTVLTFFPWEHVAQGQLGSGETSLTSFRIPAGSVGYWRDRLTEALGHTPAAARQFDHEVLRLRDPDGMNLALVGVPDAAAEAAWSVPDGVPAEHAIRGFHGVTLRVAEAAGTAAILTDVFGFAEAGREGSTTRYAVSGTTLGGVVDIEAIGGAGRPGAGSVHHVAFRAETDEQQAAMVRKLAGTHRIRTTEQLDRQYFRSVYFREPGGVLFEIATDQPGFAVDEPAEQLGQTLKLPRFLEPRRSELERRLPALA